MNIYIASDHRGFESENEIVNYLKEMGLNVFQTNINHTEKDDYVDYALELGQMLMQDKDALGILICGTGIGMSIAANKVKGIRAARCVNTSDAFYAKHHNDANVLCIAVDEIDNMKQIIDTFISTNRASEERHLNRIQKIINFENKAYNEL